MKKSIFRFSRDQKLITVKKQSFVTVITEGIRVMHVILLSEEVRASCSSQRNDFKLARNRKSYRFASGRYSYELRDKIFWQNFHPTSLIILKFPMSFQWRCSWNFLVVTQRIFRRFTPSSLPRRNSSFHHWANWIYCLWHSKSRILDKNQSWRSAKRFGSCSQLFGNPEDEATLAT